MVEEWKKAAEVSRELECKALECSPLIFFHMSPPLKDHLLFVFHKYGEDGDSPTHRFLNTICLCNFCLVCKVTLTPSWGGS